MATPSYGANAWAGIGEESTWGTAVARTKFFEILSSSLKVEQNTGFSRVTRGLDPQRRFIARQRAVGDLTTEVMYDGYLKLLKHLTGNTVSAAITAGQSYRHQFARAAALPAGLSVEVNSDQQNYLFEGCKINQCVFKFETEELASAIWSVVGETGTVQSASTPTFPTDRVILPQYGVFAWGATDYSEHVRSVEITVGNSLDGERRRIGTNTIKEPVRGSQRPDVMWRVELEHNDVTAALVVDFLAGTQRKAKLTYDSAINIGASTDKYLIKFESPASYITDCFPPVSDPGILPLTMELRPVAALAADFDLNSAQMGAIKISVQNSEAAI